MYIRAIAVPPFPQSVKMLQLTQAQKEKVEELGCRLEKELTTKLVKEIYQDEEDVPLAKVLEWVVTKEEEEEETDPQVDDWLEIVASTVNINFQHIYPRTNWPGKCPEKTVMRATVATQEMLSMMGEVISVALAKSMMREDKGDLPPCSLVANECLRNPYEPPYHY